MLTHTFKLTTGVECEVRELTSEHQDMFTRKNKPKDFFDQILSELIVRVGKIKVVDKDFCANLLAPDRNKILFEARQFSLDFPEEFVGTVEWENDEDKKITDNYSVKLSEVKETPFPFQYQEYSEVVANVDYDLTVLGIENKVRITLPNGHSEQRIQDKYKKNIGSNAQIDLYNPRVLEKKESGVEIPISMNFKKTSMRSIEDLRKQIKALVGDFDTVVAVNLPNGKIQKVNVMADPNFFFPSGLFS